MISIIIPCSKEYRRSYLWECCQSFEDSLADNELLVIPYEPDQDIFGDVLNHAVDIAKGDWILPLGADDKIVDGAISQMERLIGDDDVYYGDVELFGQQEMVCKGKKNVSLSGLLKENALPFTSLIRKSKFQEVGGYFPKRGFTEDWDLWCNLAYHGARFKYVGFPVLKYRVHPGQVWNTVKEYLEDHKKLINERWGK